MHANRRDFLTGQAALRQAQAAGEAVANAVLGEEGAVPQARDTVRLETRAMACPWAVVMNPGPPDQVMVASAALDVVHELEAVLSVYRDDTEVSRINRLASTTPQVASDTVFDLLAQCRKLCESTAGAFDPATRAPIQVWRQCRLHDRIPTTDEIDAALAATGMAHVSLDEAARTIAFDRAGVGFDFGAIGKGLALDRAMDRLASSGPEAALIHGGHSSIAARGDHAGLGGWPVGINNPLFPDERWATLLLRDQAMSTSGSNIQFFRHGGRRFGHILDPRTGWPAEGLLSATVVAPTAAEADALSTAFYVMGLEKSLEYCDNHPAIGAILIPPPATTRRLQPIVRNIPEDRLFLEPEALGDGS